MIIFDNLKWYFKYCYFYLEFANLEMMLRNLVYIILYKIVYIIYHYLKLL